MQYLHYWDTTTAHPDDAVYLDFEASVLAPPGHESIHEAIRRWHNEDSHAFVPQSGVFSQPGDWPSSDGCRSRLGGDRVHAPRFMDHPATIGGQRS